jgi:hypothetical protein
MALARRRAQDQADGGGEDSEFDEMRGLLGAIKAGDLTLDQVLAFEDFQRPIPIHFSVNKAAGDRIAVDDLAVLGILVPDDIAAP